MRAKEEFLDRELAWVRIVRKTRRPDQLHLVEPAVAREREILAELDRLRAAEALELAATGTGGGK